MNYFDVPILFVIFNRPETTRRVFNEIRRVKPTKLFIAADGPRKGNSSDIELSKKTREIVSAIDWPCETKTLFRDDNLGCKEAVSGAISWFFSNVSEGIILEDDCLPDPSFFTFCRDMIAHYRDNDGVMMISGSNLAGSWNGSGSYFFSKYANIWGWATWKRAWSKYDGSMKAWADGIGKEKARKRIGNERYWRIKAWAFERVYSGAKNSWAYAWEFAVLANNGLAVVPRLNLIENIGFDERATHTNTSSVPKAFSRPRQKMDFPISHTDTKNGPDGRYDSYFIKTAFTGKLASMKRVISLLRRIGRSILIYWRTKTSTLRDVHILRPNTSSPLYYLVHGNPKSLGTVVDVGCGFDADFSIHMIDAYYSKAFAIDPTKKHAPALQELVRKNHGDLTYIPLAISSKNGRIPFNESVENVSGSILSEHRNVDKKAVNSYEVESTDLASLPKRLGLDNVPYIKLDLEGAEYELIKNIRPGDLDKYSQLFVEFHHHAVPTFKEKDTLDMVNIISSAGFKTFTINGRDYLFYRQIKSVK